jgi:hypothetical protein
VRELPLGPRPINWLIEIALIYAAITIVKEVSTTVVDFVF